MVILMRLGYISLMLLLSHASIQGATCNGRCGEDYDRTNTCHCDSKCEKSRNCCSDYSTVCQNSTVQVRGSCEGICGEDYDKTNSCHCNSECRIYDNCCSDYTAVCLSSGTCSGRCDEDYDKTNTCHCNSKCGKYQNCCNDFSTLCGGSNGENCKSLATVSEELWDKDANRLPSGEVKVDAQGEMISDKLYDNADNKLFIYVNESQLTGSVFTTYMALLDNYDPDKGDPEVDSAEERNEEIAFLDAILATDVMDTLYDYLLCRGHVGDSQDFRDLIDKIWFELFSRSSSSSVKDTSGFEHIMMGDFKSKSTASGLHYWVFFYLMEKAGDINYYGYAAPFKTNYAAPAFEWEGRLKTITSFFLGSSPAFDIAIFTLCSLEHGGEACPVMVGGQSLTIQTYLQSGGQLATAYISA